MTTIKKVNLVLLIILSIATGVVKVCGLEADVEIFKAIGFPYAAVVSIGIVQMAGGVMLIPTVTRPFGAIVMAVTFIIASSAVFLSGMIPFGIFSILFIVMSVVAYNTKTNVKARAV